MAAEPLKAADRLREVRAYLEYFRDMGVYDFYRDASPPALEAAVALHDLLPIEDHAKLETEAPPAVEGVLRPDRKIAEPQHAAPAGHPPVESAIPKPIAFNDLAPLPLVRVAPAHRAAALAAIRAEIGDCTRCPLAYAGRRTIVFGDGDPKARLMFVGEGPGAEEDAQGLPFVGKSGQLLNNMIQAMGFKREQVYIANIVKCRPPANRAPEPVEANTCAQFLMQQIDVVQPEFIVALGTTAAMYLLGVKQSLLSLRGHWHPVRGAQAIVTYHPAFLLRDPRQKGEAWKDLQMVMAAMQIVGKRE